MPAVVRSEFALALNQVASERGIDKEIVLETIRSAILAAYRKDYGKKDLEKIEIVINPDTGEAKVLKEEKDITPAGFGRIATQTAKQVILQRVREAEKKAVISDYASKVGTIISGRILRFAGPNVIVDIGRAEGIMLPSEQVPNERYRLNQRLSFYIEKIKKGHRGSEIIVSRSSTGLVEGLFKREVPEVANKSVEIKGVAREPGSRTKIAVHSVQSGVDPVGSCVGQKGVRVQAVIAELGGLEKIDIIQWHEDAKQFIIASLSPAKDIEITLNEKNNAALAYVPENQLSLAIGKNGQNVRLAAKLTGWKIDIKAKEEKTEQRTEKPVKKKKTSKTVKKTKVKKKKSEAKIPKEKGIKENKEAKSREDSDKSTSIKSQKVSIPREKGKKEDKK